MIATLLSIISSLLVVVPDAAARAVITPNASAEAGVSHELAVRRAAAIGDVSYRLGFSVPASAAEAVTFADTITFTLAQKADVTLDFKGLEVGAVALVNGKQRGYRHQGEHLVFARSGMRKGQNTIILHGRSSDEALNRRADMLYTLFVPAHARTAFPCFDQPDMKALFSLTLSLPEGWTSISSADNGHPIPTYLFSFTAGRFHSATARRDGRLLTALYRETDSLKVAQLPKVFDQIALSIRWMERYTGISHPFDRYGVAILPSYQFGGMEHPGAIQLRDRTVFLGPDASEAEQMARLKLIAHETAHLWFGDMVTMRWFDDVWTKEVFANFMAAKVAREEFPNVDHGLNFLRAYTLTAMSTDRTDGTHPIQQQLDNLDHAGLLYGNIIYDKAPVMMRFLEQLMGEERFQRGLQAYLRRYAYANATWDDLVELLDSVAPDAGVKHFSRTWVKEKGMPVVTLSPSDGGLTMTAADPYGHGNVWPQTFRVAVVAADGSKREATVELRDSVERLPLAVGDGDIIVPNSDGMGYGRFVMRSADVEKLLHMWRSSGLWPTLAPAERLGQVATVYDNWLMGRVSTKAFVDVLLCLTGGESNALVFDRLLAYVASVMSYLPQDARWDAERRLYALASGAGERPLQAVFRQQAKRTAYGLVTAPELVDSVYGHWLHRDDAQLSLRQLTSLSYRLALLRPNEWQTIVEVQLSRLQNADERAEYERISRACSPDIAVQRSLFDGLSAPDGRRPEPQVSTLLSLLSHRLREPQNNALILPGLNLLESVRESGSIFFPTSWIAALLDGHHSDEARRLVEQWIADNETIMPQLMNKLKECSWYLRTLRPKE